MNDDELDRLVQGLPRQADVPPDVEGALWADIQSRIDPPRRSRWALGIAAAALLLAGVAAWSMRPTPSAVSPTGVALLAATPQPAPVRKGALLPAEDDLQAAVVDLERAYRLRRDALDPAVLAIFDENLDVVDDAVTRSRAALAAKPGDPHLQRMLRLAYDQQLALLTRATEPQP